MEYGQAILETAKAGVDHTHVMYMCGYWGRYASRFNITVDLLATIFGHDRERVRKDLRIAIEREIAQLDVQSPNSDLVQLERG
jgi:hypothetical protein